jgi:hypothetical protein
MGWVRQQGVSATLDQTDRVGRKRQKLDNEEVKGSDVGKTPVRESIYVRAMTVLAVLDPDYHDSIGTPLLVLILVLIFASKRCRRVQSPPI